MLAHWQRNWQGADRAEVFLRPLVPLTVQLLILELCRTLLACLLVLLAVGPLAVHAAVLDEAAGRAVLERDSFAPLLAAVSADFEVAIHAGRVVHCGIGRRKPQTRTVCQIVLGALFGEEAREAAYGQVRVRDEPFREIRR